jgi:hypothetical protein
MEGIAMPFIRLDGWCKCEHSFNSAAAVFEEGVSVYECEAVAPDKWRAKGPAWVKNKTGIIRSLKPWFLVDGKALDALGGDKEPLLKEVGVRTGLKLFDPSKDLFVEIVANSDEEKPHPACEGKCVGESAAEISGKLLDDEAGAHEHEELYRNEAGDEVPFDDLSEAEQNYYSDVDIDVAAVTLTEFCARLRVMK